MKRIKSLLCGALISRQRVALTSIQSTVKALSKKQSLLGRLENLPHALIPHLGSIGVLPFSNLRGFHCRPRTPILSLIESLHGRDNSWSAVNVLERWALAQPWRVLAKEFKQTRRKREGILFLLRTQLHPSYLPSDCCRKVAPKRLHAARNQ